MKKILISLLLIFFITACNNKYNAGGVNNVQPEQVESKLNNYIVLDVRTPVEFSEGHLPNAINVDVTQDNFEEEVNKLDKNLSYLVYCRSGKRSATATTKMMSLGFKNITNMEGGILNWKGEIIH